MQEDDANRVFALVPVCGIGPAPHVTQKIAGQNVVAANAIALAIDDKKLVALQANGHGAGA